MRIYLDLDDTLADFTGACRRAGVHYDGEVYHTNHRSTWTPEQVDFQARLNDLMDSDTFWPNVGVLPGAFELISAAATRADTFILTAVPAGTKRNIMIAEQKVAWARDNLHIPGLRVYTCQRSRKATYAQDWRSGPHVLLDDSALNISEWHDAGGFGLLHTDFDSSLAALKNL